MHLPIKTALLLVASLVQAHPRPNHQNKAVYVLRNTAENAVIGLPVSPNGILGEGIVTLTGGRGGTAVTSDQEPSGPDALFSQAPLTVAGEYVFAVNPGSNTLSMLKANHHNPAVLTLVGEPIPIPGEFPVTVAASPKNKLACVGTTGRKAGISCASFTEHGLDMMDALRPYNLNQTTPPSGPPNGIAHTFFSADESQLFTTVKGTPGADIGFFSVFPVRGSDACASGKKSATLARHDIRSSFNGTNLLFGSAIVPSSSHIFVTDPTFGVAVLDVNENTHKTKLLSRVPIPGQMALCWASYSAARRTVFVSDGALNRLVELNATDASIVSVVHLPNQDPSHIDIQAAGDYVYALSPGNGTTEASIAVYDTMEMKQIQHVSLKSNGGDKNAVGVAYLEL
ncbi:hypothetical protein BDW59DRAFT_182215 [Aspergillus cavernicola]|uniref:Lactonase, 7-bladed beta-propeller-domain-containing protein n=1 Tax=Aspergillus cavernicola TaxID=176166 RepID=A0ABR4HQC5_9EURO